MFIDFAGRITAARMWTMNADKLEELRERAEACKQSGWALMVTVQYDEVLQLLDEIERLNNALNYEQYRTGRQGTHAEGCYKWGPEHYECAMPQLDAERKRRELAESQCAVLIENYCAECDHDPDVCRVVYPEMQCAVRKLDDSAGTALLARSKRMEDALRYVQECLVPISRTGRVSEGGEQDGNWMHVEDSLRIVEEALKEVQG